MVIDGSPPVGAVPDEFATGFAASLDFLEALLFVASENDRAAVRRNGFGPPARLRSVFIGGDLSTFSATDPEGNGMEASVDPQPWGPDWMPITPERGPCCMPKLR
jgi:hypothetical protein